MNAKCRIKRHLHNKDIAVIGGANGPTAIYVTNKLNSLAVVFTLGTIFGMIISIIAASRHGKRHG